MNLDWQTAVVLAMVSAACGYLARLLWQTVSRRRAAACGSCGNCAAGADKRGPTVISLSASGTPNSPD